jgi:hypothetical protein
MQDDCLRMHMSMPTVPNERVPGVSYVVNGHKLLTVQYGVI